MRLDVAYDGTAYAGWARQPGLATVQGELERALAVSLRHDCELVVAGRTDAGVHATGQVCHTDVPADGPLPDARRLNGLLPPDVRVRSVTAVDPAFDARFSALWRRYRYRVVDDPAHADPLRRHDTLAWPRPVDDDALAAAAAPLVGLHDFASFCRRREGATTVRTVLDLAWAREAGALVMTVTADAFCHSMVRALVGAQLVVGDGRRPAGWATEVLAGRKRDSGFPVVPPHGLTLVEVGYPDDPAAWAARQAETRNVRPALEAPSVSPVVTDTPEMR